eukprot:CAMPEP_0172541708 /NCGR_PEP_ID=MMETSP1067-20121228/12475_1 /TAXON_ID=265564 ORGANISM="Thalassiosira punctigera, Strain Tpunct2005C2" /NCGR_SAMPLE_ID=MMETSP1067 /ASSEMBLY_ACC=CAM_ASM_000444 /LENGTH=355 /DNA_ID=CAMNT_0013327803 /DNA_START=97 /DNA_END=1164 /DNA_ORIENTATION=-
MAVSPQELDEWLRFTDVDDGGDETPLCQGQGVEPASASLLPIVVPTAPPPPRGHAENVPESSGSRHHHRGYRRRSSLDEGPPSSIMDVAVDGRFGIEEPTMPVTTRPESEDRRAMYCHLVSDASSLSSPDCSVESRGSVDRDAALSRMERMRPPGLPFAETRRAWSCEERSQASAPGRRPGQYGRSLSLPSNDGRAQGRGLGVDDASLRRSESASSGPPRGSASSLLSTMERSQSSRDRVQRLVAPRPQCNPHFAATMRRTAESRKGLADALRCAAEALVRGGRYPGLRGASVADPRHFRNEGAGTWKRLGGPAMMPYPTKQHETEMDDQDEIAIQAELRRIARMQMRMMKRATY